MDEIREKIDFLKNAFLDPKVGAVTRSSKYLIKNVLKRLGNKLDTIVEYGSGDGVVTRELLKHLSSRGKLIAIETNAQFVKKLRDIPGARIRVLHQKVQDVRWESVPGFRRADVVISSIPFSFLKPADRAKVVARTHQILTPGGRFIVYQYSWLMFKPLNKQFSSVKVSFEPRNIPPFFIMDAKK